jgi:transposase
LAEHLEVTQRTVCLWCRRYREAGLAWLRTRPRAGRPLQISAARERAVLNATLRKPAAATHWSTRRLAREIGLSRASVHSIVRHGRDRDSARGADATAGVDYFQLFALVGT